MNKIQNNMNLSHYSCHLQITPRQSPDKNNNGKKIKGDSQIKQKREKVKLIKRLQNSWEKQLKSKTVSKNINHNFYESLNNTMKINPEEKFRIRQIILPKKNDFKYGIITLEMDRNKFFLIKKHTTKKNKSPKRLDPIRHKNGTTLEKSPHQKIASQIQTESKIFNINDKYFRRINHSKIQNPNYLIQRYYKDSDGDDDKLPNYNTKLQKQKSKQKVQKEQEQLQQNVIANQNLAILKNTKSIKKQVGLLVKKQSNVTKEQMIGIEDLELQGVVQKPQQQQIQQVVIENIEEQQNIKEVKKGSEIGLKQQIINSKVKINDVAKQQTGVVAKKAPQKQQDNLILNESQRIPKTKQIEPTLQTNQQTHKPINKNPPNIVATSNQIQNNSSSNKNLIPLSSSPPT